MKTSNHEDTHTPGKPYKKKKPAKERDTPSPGRPPLLTPTLIKKICKLLTHGCFLETACIANGLPRHVLHSWLKKGKEVLTKIELEEPTTRQEMWYAQFHESIFRAIAQGEAKHVERIQFAAEHGEWQAGKFLLTHGPAKSRWAPLTQKDVKVKGEVNHKHSFVPVDSLNLTLEEKIALYEKVKASQQKLPNLTPQDNLLPYHPEVEDAIHEQQESEGNPT